MTKPFQQVLSDRRRLLKHPYAYIAELEEIEALKAAHKKSECPYAYEDELSRLHRLVSRFDGIDVDSPHSNITEYKPRTDLEIQQLARDLLIQIWENRKTLFSDHMSRRPIDMLDPVIALELQGYQVEISGALGPIIGQENLSNIAGLIDKQNRRVFLSSKFPPATRNFTAAHELGHAVMHDLVGMHRDRPLDGASSSNDPKEREAEKFAAYFLMPEKLVKKVFESIFGQAPFVLTEETRFALAGSLPNENWAPRNRRDLSRLLRDLLNKVHAPRV